MKRPAWLSLAWFDSLGKIVAGLTAIVVLITGIVSLVLLLLPKPLPLRKATLTDLQLVAQESYGDFLQETGQSARGHSQAELHQLGNYYIVRVNVEGLQNQNPEIVWSVHSRGRKTQLQPELWIHQPVDAFKPPASSYEFTAQVWVQRPPVPGKFYALLEIDYPQYAPLAIAFSKDFTVAPGETPSNAKRATTTVTRTYSTVTTVPTHTTITGTTGEQTTSTSSTTAPTTTPATTPGTATTTPVTTTETVTSPAPIVRPPAVTVASP